MESLFWADQIASDVVKQWKVPLYRAEMGFGASGIPHVGSVGDAVRSYAIALALKDTGKKSELVAFSDDRDGLRKVPSGFPATLEKEVGKSVSLIPDPFGCHASFALHITTLLADAMEKLNISFTLKRAHEEYEKGTLDNEIVTILSKANQAAEIVKRETGSEKFLTQLPYLPICPSCSRIYTTRAIQFDAKAKKVEFACDGEFIGKAGSKEIPIKGCGAKGWIDIRKGKLAWKVEFAARWHALDVHFEAYGKDILDSVRCNDAICREILGREPPVHAFYELFTERGGAKISKSKGNVFTPQKWLEYATPASLRLLFLKRLAMTRVVDMQTIPLLMDEVDALEKVYTGEDVVDNERERNHKKRLFEFTHLLKPPKAGVRVSYSTLVHLVSSLPVADKEHIITEILQGNGNVPKNLSKEQQKELVQRIRYADGWAATQPRSTLEFVATTDEKNALGAIAQSLKKKMSADDIQSSIFNQSKSSGIKPQRMFALVYQALIGMDRGPKAGHLIELLGQEKVARLLEERAK